MKSCNASDANIAVLRSVVARMGTNRKKVVFLGGAIIPLLLTQKVVLDIRLSKDVDFISNFASKKDVYAFEDKLWEQGFKNKSTGAVCRWVIDDITIDNIPADPDILGINNQWCLEAFHQAKKVDIGEGIIINIIPAPCFLGVKLNAFYRRANDDYVKSYDIYDIILVTAGRPEIEREILEQASPELKAYLSSELKKLLNKTNDLLELAPQYFQSSQALKQLFPKVVSRIKRIITIN